MELKRSKIFKMKNKDEKDLTAKEREFRKEILKQARFGRDEKALLSIAMIVLLIVSFFLESDEAIAACFVFMFFTGMAGIIR